MGFVGSHEREERETVRERWRQTDSQPDIPTNRANARARARARESECVCVPERKRQTEWVSGCERECVFLCAREGKRDRERERESK